MSKPLKKLASRASETSGRNSKERRPSSPKKSSYTDNLGRESLNHFGKLLPDITEPGHHFVIPIVTNYSVVQLKLRVSTITNTSCGSSDGLIITFGLIEVEHELNRENVVEIVRNYSLAFDRPLIYNRVRDELYRFCEKYTAHEIFLDSFKSIEPYLKEVLTKEMPRGVRIKAVRVSKLRVPRDLKRSFETLEMQRVKALIASEKQKVAEAEAKAEQIRAIAEAKKTSELRKIEMQKALEEKEFQKQMAAIDEKIYQEQQRRRVDAETYKMRKMAEANKCLHTPEYIELKKYDSLRNSKVVFGSADQSVWSSIFSPKAREAGRDVSTTENNSCDTIENESGYDD